MNRDDLIGRLLEKEYAATVTPEGCNESYLFLIDGYEVFPFELLSQSNITYFYPWYEVSIEKLKYLVSL